MIPKTTLRAVLLHNKGQVQVHSKVLVVGNTASRLASHVVWPKSLGVVAGNMDQVHNKVPVQVHSIEPVQEHNKGQAPERVHSMEQASSRPERVHSKEPVRVHSMELVRVHSKELVRSEEEAFCNESA